MTRCRRMVFHDGGGPLGAFIGGNERCKRKGIASTHLIDRGLDTQVVVLVCAQHAKEIKQRKELGMSCPPEWYSLVD